MSKDGTTCEDGTIAKVKAIADKANPKIEEIKIYKNELAHFLDGTINTVTTTPIYDYIINFTTLFPNSAIPTTTTTTKEYIEEMFEIEKWNGDFGIIKNNFENQYNKLKISSKEMRITSDLETYYNFLFLKEKAKERQTEDRYFNIQKFCDIPPYFLNFGQDCLDNKIVFPYATSDSAMFYLGK